MSRSVAAHIQKDKAFANMIRVFTSNCHKDGFHPPSLITEELFQKIGRPGASLSNVSLNFKGCDFEDQVLSYLMDALAVYPVVESLDLSQNSISDSGARYLLKLLRAQTNLVKKIHIDKRLYATFISEVDLTDNYATISPEVQDEINMMCEALLYANVQTAVRRAFLNNGCRHHVSDNRMNAVWDDVIKQQFPALRDQLEEQEEIRHHYATGVHQHSHKANSRRPLSPGRSVGSTSNYNSTSVYSSTTHGSITTRLPVPVAEVAIMRALQAADRVPYLTRWQYALLAVQEVRKDESFSDKSVLYASTVFDQMDSLSVSASHIAFSPVAKDRKKIASSESARCTSVTESNSEQLYHLIDSQDKGFITAKDLEAALESSAEVVQAFMLYMSGDFAGHDKDDLSTLDSGSLFSMSDESKNLVRLMDTQNNGRIKKQDFLTFVNKSASAICGDLSIKDLCGSSGYENSSPNQFSKRGGMNPLSVTFSEAGNISAYQGEYSPCRDGSGASDTATLVSNLMTSFLQRVKFIGAQENLEDETSFVYDKTKEEEIVKRKQDKVEFFCTEYFDSSGTGMEALAIPRSLEYGNYSNLRVLCLKDNSMVTVDGSVLNLLSKLRSLDLSHNLIENLGRKMFPKSIRILNLSYNLLQDTNWSNLISGVIELNLAGNEIEIVDILPSKLAKLNIADNKVSSVVSLRVMALHKITSLTITGNPIVQSTKFLKATISSLFPLLEELDGSMLPRRVNSRIVRRASSSMSVNIVGESRGRLQMTQTYQKQLDKKRSDEFKIREQLRQEKLREYIESFAKTMRRRKTSPQKLESIINRLYNAKHSSKSQVGGRITRAGSADSVKAADAKDVPKRNTLSLSPPRIEALTMRLYRGSHHRVHKGPPTEHPSSPRKNSSSPRRPEIIQPFSPRSTTSRKDVSRVTRPPAEPLVHLNMPAAHPATDFEQGPIDRRLNKNSDIDDDSFMARPPIAKKPPAPKPDAAPALNFSKRVKQMLNQFVAMVNPIKSNKISEYVIEKIHEFAESADVYLAPFVAELESMSIDGVLGIEPSPGNVAFHKMNEDQKESHSAHWILSQVAACVRSAENEMKAPGFDADMDSDTTGNDFPFSECVHMAASMSPFLKENPVNWMFCASVLRRLESKRFPGRKLATYQYSPLPAKPEVESETAAADVLVVAEPVLEILTDPNIGKSVDSNEDDKSIDTFNNEETPDCKVEVEVKRNRLPEMISEESKQHEFEEVRQHLVHSEPIQKTILPSFPTPPDHHTLTAKRGIEIFERNSSSIGGDVKMSDPAPALDTPRELSFIDTENETVGSPPIIPRRRSKSSSSFPAGDEISARATEGSPLRQDSPITSLKSGKDETVSLRSLVAEKIGTDSQQERPNSRNSVTSHASHTDDQAAGDVFSRMHSLKSRISNSSVPNIPRSNTNDSHDDNRSIHSNFEEDLSPRMVPSITAVPVHAAKMQPLPNLDFQTVLSIKPTEVPVIDDKIYESKPIITPRAQLVKSPSSPDSAVSNDTNMSAVERLKARLAKKGAEDKVVRVDPPENVQMELRDDVPLSSVAHITLPKKLLKKSLSIDAKAPIDEFAPYDSASVTESKISPEKNLRKPLSVDAASEPISVPTTAALPQAPTPKRSSGDTVGSFSAAIAQALPSPSQRSTITGVSPPQKLLGNPMPPSPGGRMMYRGPSPAHRISKTFDFLDTVMSTIEKVEEQNDDDSENTHSPKANINVEPLTKTRKSMIPSPATEFVGSLSQATFLSASPGSLDDKSIPSASAASPVITSTYVPVGIASIGKKPVELAKSRSTPEEKIPDFDRPPIVQKSASNAQAISFDDAKSETSSTTEDPSRPAPLSRKSSFSTSMKSMFGLKKKDHKSK